MRYARTDSFKGDYKHLTESEKTRFRESFPAFSDAADAFKNERQGWPSRFRVKQVQGTKDIFEMTWSFSGPDGRSTWRWTTVTVTEGGKVRRYPAVLWRRVGGHEVFRDP